jgi:hypothetical protein
MDSQSVNNLKWDELARHLLDESAKDENLQGIVDALGPLLRRLAHPPLYQKLFPAFERFGFHLTPVHYYQPIPDTRALSEECCNQVSLMPGVDMNERRQLQLLEEAFPQFGQEYNAFSKGANDAGDDFDLNNTMFAGTDALTLYCMVRHFRPRRIFEVGSGISSRLSAKALLVNGSGELTCIEPYPNELLKRGFPGLSALIPKPVQDVSVEHFQELRANDILFIDSSHVVKIGGDVNYLFLEVLPRLAPGVIVHVHDIFLPMAGKMQWVMKDFRFWTEQYLLQAFLIFNSQFEVLFSCTYLGIRHVDKMRATFPNSPWWGGGSFWMQRRAEAHTSPG